METNRIKIVFGVNDFLAGGMQRQFVEQLRHFDTTRLDITLITLLEFPHRPSFFDELPPTLTVHRFNFSGLFDIRSWWRLSVLLRKIHPDIVVSSLFFSNTVFRVLRPIVGYVAIAREHNTYVHKPKWQQYIDYVLAFHSRTIVAVSKTVMEFTASQERIPREKFTVIQNGIDTQRCEALLAALPTQQVLRKELGLRPDDTVFLNTSRLIPQKDYSLLISGFGIFHKTHPASQLAIVGGGELKESLQELVTQECLSDSVLFFGHRTDVLKFYKVANFFVSTSEIEGFSNSMLEALAAGVPVVATRTAGTDELIEEGRNGFFITERSAHSVAACFQQALEHSFQKNEVQATVSHFDVRDTVARYTALFEKSLTPA